MRNVLKLLLMGFANLFLLDLKLFPISTPVGWFKGEFKSSNVMKLLKFFRQIDDCSTEMLDLIQ